MKYVHSACYNILNEACSKRAHDHLSISWDQTQKCVKDSFTGTNWGHKNTNNTIIDQEIEYWKKYGSGIYPSIVINNRTYRGQLESLAVLNGLCAGFANPPNYC